jgi:hypothetical protein
VGSNAILQFILRRCKIVKKVVQSFIKRFITSVLKIHAIFTNILIYVPTASIEKKICLAAMQAPVIKLSETKSIQYPN